MRYAIVDIETNKIICYFSEQHKELAYETSKQSQGLIVKKLIKRN